jgi:hypothetical protein
MATVTYLNTLSDLLWNGPLAPVNTDWDSGTIPAVGDTAELAGFSPAVDANTAVAAVTDGVGGSAINGTTGASTLTVTGNNGVPVLASGTGPLTVDAGTTTLTIGTSAILLTAVSGGIINYTGGPINLTMGAGAVAFYSANSGSAIAVHNNATISGGGYGIYAADSGSATVYGAVVCSSGIGAFTDATGTITFAVGCSFTHTGTGVSLSGTSQVVNGTVHVSGISGPTITGSGTVYIDQTGAANTIAGATLDGPTVYLSQPTTITGTTFGDVGEIVSPVIWVNANSTIDSTSASYATIFRVAANVTLLTDSTDTDVAWFGNGIAKTSDGLTVFLPSTVPTKRTASSSGTGATTTISWNAFTTVNKLGGLGYRLYRSTVNGFTPGAGNLVVDTTATSYDVSNVAGTPYYYRVIAYNAQGPAPASDQQTYTADAPVPDTGPTDDQVYLLLLR